MNYYLNLGPRIFQRLPNGFDCGVQILVNILIRKAHNVIALAFQYSGSVGIIIYCVQVRGAINFHDKLLSNAEKINDISPNGDLPTKFITSAFAVPKLCPNKCFGGRLVAPQMFGESCFLHKRRVAVKRKSWNPSSEPSAHLLPMGEGE